MNMPVLGQSAFVISKSGKTADVNAFSPDYESKQIPIVDALFNMKIHMMAQHIY